LTHIVCCTSSLYPNASAPQPWRRAAPNRLVGSVNLH
jgi:hypothetical protein